VSFELSSDVSGCGGIGAVPKSIRELTQPISCLPISSMHLWKPHSGKATYQAVATIESVVSFTRAVPAIKAKSRSSFYLIGNCLGHDI
jgi:hypothetical protein